MQNAEGGKVLGYTFIITFLVFNIILIVKLIVGQLAHAYKVF